MADPIARNERSDIARLEPFADARRHVVADEGLHPARPGQAAERQRPRIYPKRPRHRDRRLSRVESRAVPETSVDRPETHPASAHALDLVSPLDALTARQAEETTVVAAYESQGWRERVEELQQRRRPARGHGHGHRDALALEDSRRGDRARERPVAGRPATPDPQEPQQYGEHRDDQLGPARQHAEHEPPGTDRHDREGQRREPRGHPVSSVFGAGTWVRRSSTTCAADSFVTQSSG